MIRRTGVVPLDRDLGQGGSLWRGIAVGLLITLAAPLALLLLAGAFLFLAARQALSAL